MEKVSKCDLLSSLDAEAILFQLFRHALFLKKETTKDTLKVKIRLGRYYSVTQDFDEEPGDIVKEIIRQLKNAGIVKDCSEFFRGDEDPDDYEVAYTNCTYYPNKVVAQLEAIWKPKRETVQKLIPIYQKFTELVLEYLKSSEPLDKSSNEYYLQLKDEIASLAKHLDSSLMFTRCIPFESLYSARKELDEKKTTLMKVSNEMLDFYGKLVDREKSLDFDKYKKRELDLQAIDAHISGLEKKNKQGVQTLRGYKNTPIKKPFAGTLREEVRIGQLAYFSDGTIKFDDKEIELRSQIKDLCRLFMVSPNQIITIDDIRESIVASAKRKNTSNATISKYVSEFHNKLKLHFKKDVIFNEKEVGWRLEI